MDEFTAVVKARELVRSVGESAIPAPVDAYVQSVGAVNQALEKTAAPAPWKPLCDSHFFCTASTAAILEQFSICVSRPRTLVMPRA
jgi:hypothetical protein